MWFRVVAQIARNTLLRLGIRAPLRESHEPSRSWVGQSMVEYAIVAALIAIVAMAAVEALGGGIAQVFENILSRIQGIGG